MRMLLFETIDDIAVGDVRTKIKDILGAFMFHGDDVTKSKSPFRRREKTRLAMIKLLEPVNLLILDDHPITWI
jgi:ATP-binding cassette subfamily F protein 3